MTAVEWLAEQMMHPNNFNPYIEQAKEMEKQQIIDCFEFGIGQGFISDLKKVEEKKMEFYKWYCEQLKQK